MAFTEFPVTKSPFKNREDIENELQKEFRKIQKAGKCLEDSEIEDKLDVLTRWLSSAPKNIVYRVNTLLTQSRDVIVCIENDLEMQMKLKGQSRPLPSISTFAKIPELIIVNVWDDEIDLDLKIQSKEVIVNGKCGEAVIRGADVFAPGVVGMPHGLKVGQTVSVFADIVHGCKKGFIKQYANENKLFLGNGFVQMTREDIFGHEVQNASGVAVLLIDVISRLPQLNDKKFQNKGWSLLQNLPSIICSRVLNPQPGEIILDMCAAPGHKTTHISALMEGKGIIMALEKNKNKLEGLKKHCQSFCAENVHCFCFDSTKALSDIEKRPILEGPPFSKESFDRILLDGPCSALGQRPQIFNPITVSLLNSYIPLQRKLFSTAVELLKPGGTLIYSTCTITLAENENIVAWALKKYPVLKLQSVKDKILPLQIPECGTSGFNIEGLSLEQSNSLLRFGPESDSIGFFIACFTKETNTIL